MYVFLQLGSVCVWCIHVCVCVYVWCLPIYMCVCVWIYMWGVCVCVCFEGGVRWGWWCSWWQVVCGSCVVVVPVWVPVLCCLLTLIQRDGGYVSISHYLGGEGRCQACFSLSLSLSYSSLLFNYSLSLLVCIVFQLREGKVRRCADNSVGVMVTIIIITMLISVILFSP